VAEVLVREPDFFRPKQESDPLGLKLVANRAAGSFVKRAHRLLQYAVARRGCSDDQGAIGDGIGNRLVFFCLAEHVRGTHGGTGLAKARRVGIHEAQAINAEIAHRTRRGANIQRIARAYQHHDETVKF
jgi:hypothetical protein